MSLDRTLAPAFQPVTDVHLLQASEQKLSNGIPVFCLDAGTQEVVKIEWQFAAGIRSQPQPLVATAVNDMLDEGIAGRSAEELAEELDYYGAFIESETTHDVASFTLYSLNRHLPSVLPLVRAMLFEPVFPAAEFEVYLSNRRQKFVVDSAKVGNMARRGFAEFLFGATHPYGAKAELEDFDRLGREQLVNFHRSFYTPAACTIIAAGKVTDEVIGQLEKTFGALPLGEKPVSALTLPAPVTHPALIHTLEKNDALQSAIRTGCMLFNKTHADYHPMQVLNTVLGGYFGSRLMANIREDKGYTYGIGSGLVSLQHAGYFVISTEVGVNVTNATLHEIRTELDKLRQEEIPADELELVRNYMTGVFLRSTDGPFALADRLKGLLGYNLSYEYYNRFLHTVQSITAAELQGLAQKYLAPEKMTEVVAGKRA
ncbi:MAG: insulinase family protein [Bacteroidia bacterium]|jgi:predicted Zn-dependent peptidase|nr:insulinase family protein [Bacteroidia bacterium]